MNNAASCQLHEENEVNCSYSVYKEVENILRCLGHKGAIDADVSLSSIGVDSFCMAMLVCKLESVLGIELQRELTLDNVDTVNELIGECSKRMWKI